MRTMNHPRWMSLVLWSAAVYNVAWGTFVVACPLALFRWASLDLPNYPQVWQCVGMVVGVYGVGFALAASDPVHHWRIVLVGLLGKLFGALGLVWAAREGSLPWVVGWLVLMNDLIWVIPFTLILRRAFGIVREREVFQ